MSSSISIFLAVVAKETADLRFKVAMTIRRYAHRKKWDLREVEEHLSQGTNLCNLKEGEQKNNYVHHNEKNVK